jgi:1-acyl-sn-glycerol-3-phosphate acyltransferase
MEDSESIGRNGLQARGHQTFGNESTTMFDRIARFAMLGAARWLTGVRAVWPDSGIPVAPCVFFGNHVSHGDFALIWSVLPTHLRGAVRPVAGADYWEKDALRRYVGRHVVRAVLIERDKLKRTQDPIEQMSGAIAAGSSLILFPEGTRNQTDAPLLPLKSGLFHLAERHPTMPMVPVWIDNLHRVLPKGEILPVPLLCTARFGEPLRYAGESKSDFLIRAANAMLALRPPESPD